MQSGGTRGGRGEKKKLLVRYCTVCNTRIPRADVEAGKAQEVGGQAYCRDHLRQAEAQRKASGAHPPAGSKKKKRKKTGGSGTSRLDPGTGSRQATRRRAAGTAPPPRDRKTAAVAAALGVAALLLLIVVALIASSGTDGGGNRTATNDDPESNGSTNRGNAGTPANDAGSGTNGNRESNGSSTNGNGSNAGNDPDGNRNGSAGNDPEPPANNSGTTDPDPEPDPPPSTDRPRVEVDLQFGSYQLDRVLDGDTIKLRGLRESVRLVGVDTEETFKDSRTGTAAELEQAAADNFASYCRAQQGRNRKPETYGTPAGEKAFRWTRQQLATAEVIELDHDKDWNRTDIFGRNLCWVWYRSQGEWKNLNLELVRNGHSPYYSKYGYVGHYHSEMQAAQEAARQAGTGIWDPGEKHYPDYDDRLAWWRRCGDAFHAYEELRTRDPDNAPLALNGARDEKRLEAVSDGTVVEIFARAWGFSASKKTINLDYKYRVDLSVEFATLGDFRAAWDDDMIEEMLYVRGRIYRDGRGWRVDVESPDDVHLYAE